MRQQIRRRTLIQSQSAAVRLKPLKIALENTLNTYQETDEIRNDPVSWVLNFTNNRDREVGAFIAALFSYGRVAQIQNTLEKIRLILGENPADKLIRGFPGDWLKIVPEDFRHRFNDQIDLVFLLSWLGEALRNHGTLEDFFINENQNPPSIDLHGQIESFVSRLMNLSAAPLVFNNKRGLVFLLPRPSRKSACKRMLLFLRWVVGSGPMDLGIWTKVSRSQLIIPLDTHVLRISRHLDLTRRQDQSWQTALEITEKLKLLDPADPTRFDFAICHLGISQECPSVFDMKVCPDCRMNKLCRTYQRRRIRPR